MKELKNCYLIDSLENIGAYAQLGGNFAKACEFLARGDFDSLTPGKNVIDGDRVFVNNVEAQYVLPEERRPELHRKYFDIHVPLSCDERIGPGGGVVRRPQGRVLHNLAQDVRARACGHDGRCQEGQEADRQGRFMIASRRYASCLPMDP